MAIMPIRLYPDPVLRETCAPITTFDDALRTLADDMVETMYAAPGVGLAAPQVGINQRLAIVDISVGREADGLHVFVNPKLVETQGAEVDTEGCLSIPELTEKVRRPATIRVAAHDLDGEPFELEAEGYFARAICHEMDHLEGVLFVDHLRGLRRERARRQLKRLQREAESA
ncbi:MAG: peptide deformylase [Acidobacteriota bacterium]